MWGKEGILEIAEKIEIQEDLMEGFNKKALKVMEFSILGGGRGLPDLHNFFQKKNVEKNVFFPSKGSGGGG